MSKWSIDCSFELETSTLLTIAAMCCSRVFLEWIFLTFSSRIMNIQIELTERAVELLQLPENVPCYLLDLGYTRTSAVVSPVIQCYFTFLMKSLEFFLWIVCSMLLFLCSCGSGLSGESLTGAGHYWVGMDISPSMLGPFPIFHRFLIKFFLSRVTFQPFLPVFQRWQWNGRSRATWFRAI